MPYFEENFSVRSHKLLYDGKNVDFFQTPNYSRRGTFDPKYLILHYTASVSAASAINWFKNSNANASAHFIVDYDGKITQCGKLNQKLWHAGKSNYRGINGLNGHSFGIELVNPGHMEILSDGRYKSWFGKVYTQGDFVEAEDGNLYQIEIVEDVHEIMGGKKYGWMLATPEQIESTIMLGSFLMNKYNLRDVLPHELISKGRKWDTGPTLPKSVYDRISNRDDSKEDESTFEVSVNTFLNMRAWPSFESRVIAKLPNNTMVDVERYKEDLGVKWAKIRTFEDDMEGWVASNFLRKV